SPADRYDTCVEFAQALGRRLNEVADETGASEATSAAISVGPRHRSKPKRSAKPEPAAARSSKLRRPGVIVTAILALLVIGVSAVAVLLFREERHQSTAESRAPTPAMPVVLLGADCATLGGAVVTSTGAQAYCSRLGSTGDPVWSLYTQVPSPSAATPGPTDEVYPDGIEQQVRVCVEETHKTRLQCREDIRQGNITGPA
ncbi:MAG TPA: hypothetical protein VN738_08060, partial [Acidothermaceae bacterium]|nr:hypothetical protein [Acidothermaceae bacterium]